MKLLLAALCVAANAAAAGVARTPPMGYNTWYDVGGAINASYIESVAAALARSGLAKAGYVHLNMDDGFIAPKTKTSLLPDPGGRLANGSLYADPVHFPRGLGALSAAVAAHAPVRLGGYTARGDREQFLL